MKASVTQVPLGSITIEGLMDDTGTYYVAVSQAAEFFQLAKDHATRDIKAILGASFQLAKLSSELNPKAVNVLTLSQFELLLNRLDRAGNKVAQELRDDLAGLALVQLFSDAFGIRMEAEARQEWMETRHKVRKQHRATLTDHWLQDGAESGLTYAKLTNQVKNAMKLPTAPIGSYDVAQLASWDKAQTRYGNARELGRTHREALDFVGKAS